MFDLGFTRSRHARDHGLFTPDTFVRAPLPGVNNVTTITHTAPVLGAKFSQFTLEFAEGGIYSGTAKHCTRFIYVLDGEVELHTTGSHKLGQAGYALIPAGTAHSITAQNPSQVLVYDKPYQALEGVAHPQFFVGNENHITPTFLNGDEGLMVRSLIPEHISHDFAVNTMEYLPGASLPFVEIHSMEHGLVMLAGGGIYRLSDSWYPVQAGDFIYMAPYCPQWFCAIGKQNAKYILYKDWYRHPQEQ